MRKIVVGGAAAAMGLAVALAPWASAGNPNSNGAQKSTLGIASGDAAQDCDQSAGGNGFAILNGPGQPGMIKFLNGEVHLVGGADAANQTFDIWIGNDSNGCVKTGDTVSTNGQGIGNGHIHNALGFPAGTYWVVLTDSMSTAERFASTAVPIN